MFKKIFIVNWGEIVCRIVKMVCNFGIKVVVVYLEVDKNVFYVWMLDEVVFIGFVLFS